MDKFYELSGDYWDYKLDQAVKEKNNYKEVRISTETLGSSFVILDDEDIETRIDLSDMLCVKKQALMDLKQTGDWEKDDVRYFQYEQGDVLNYTSSVQEYKEDNWGWVIPVNELPIDVQNLFVYDYGSISFEEFLKENNFTTDEAIKYITDVFNKNGYTEYFDDAWKIIYYYWGGMDSEPKYLVLEGYEEFTGGNEVSEEKQAELDSIKFVNDNNGYNVYISDKGIYYIKLDLDDFYVYTEIDSKAVETNAKLNIQFFHSEFLAWNQKHNIEEWNESRFCETVTNIVASTTNNVINEYWDSYLENNQCIFDVTYNVYTTVDIDTIKNAIEKQMDIDVYKIEIYSK